MRIKQLLTESVSSNDIIKSIKDTRLVKIYYKGSDNHPVAGYRIIEPITYGMFKPKNKRFGGKSIGKECIRAWVVQESPSGDKSVSSTPEGTIKQGGIDPLSKIPGYRMFLLERITSYEVLDVKFDARKVFIDKNRPKYRPSTDKDIINKKAYVQVSTKSALDPNFMFEILKNKFDDVINKLFPNKKNKLKQVINRLSFIDFKDSTFNSESDYQNFINNVGKETKVEQISTFIILRAMGRENFSGLRQETRNKIRKSIKDLTKKFDTYYK